MTVHSTHSEPELVESVNATFGEAGLRLKLLREACGFSQRELAKRAGLTNSSISIIEQGQVSPSIQSLGRILAAFPISLADFFTFSFPVSNAIPSASHASCHQLSARTEELNAEQSTPFQVLSVDVSGVVVKGTVVLNTLLGERHLSIGDSFYIPARQCYRMTNSSSAPAAFFLCSLFAQKS